ncbi:MAG TPA: hypothetical protein VJU61_04795 [Polyangiaceae bacterium]|nr:hypothetical protein [Polyangiaceae bacterium]
MPRTRAPAVFACCGLLALACAHVEAEAPPPEAPAAEPAKAADAPKTTLLVTSAPIESLRSLYVSALEFTFQNPSGQWHQVRKVSIVPERQLGPSFEAVVGEHLRAWQLAARATHDSKNGPPHPALETLAPEAPPKAATEGAEPAAPAGPPDYLLSGPFTVAPGLFTRKWVALYSAAPDALLGQDLVLSYELEDGKTERLLVPYPKPAAKP